MRQYMLWDVAIATNKFVKILRDKPVHGINFIGRDID